MIIAMDSNAQAFPLPKIRRMWTFFRLAKATLGPRLFPKRAGLTCCQDEADNNPVSQLYQRIDLVLTHGKVSSVGSCPDWERSREAGCPTDCGPPITPLSWQV